MTRFGHLDEGTYAAWRAGSVRDYAAEKIEAGTWLETDALERSEREFRELLPEGLNTPGQELLAILEDDTTPAGVIWFTIEDRPVGRVVFIYDLVVFPEHRRRGHAQAALAEADAYAREHRCVGVQLHVSGPNMGARELYRKAGFVETDVTMLKRV